MNESERQAYLQAMGIEVVYPRQPLVRARPSPHYEFPESPAKVAQDGQGIIADTPPRTTSASPESGARRARVLVDLGDSDSNRMRRAVTREKSAAAINPKPDQGITASGDASPDSHELRFQLAYYRVAEQLAVLLEWPLESRAPGADALELLQNILLALGIVTETEKLTPEALRWPLADDMPAAEASAEHARQTLTGFIAKRRQRDNCSNLLVFTSRLATLLPGASREQGSGEFTAHKIQCQICCVDSLQAMLALPALKRDVWQQLQPLRKRLQQSSS